MKALITGVTGQIGSYAADHLIDQDYEVIGLIRRASVPTTERISHLLDNPNFTLIECDLLDSGNINSIIANGNIDEIYHYAFQSHVKTSFDNPHSTLDFGVLGTLNILESIRHLSPNTKFYNSSSSEQFGGSMGNIYDDGIYRQDEDTVFWPNSPYAVAKVAAHHLVRVYRESYNIFACNGITFNSESPRRGELFVTRKITKYVAQLEHFKSSLKGSFSEFPKLRLGNIETFRDWGFAGDVPIAAQLMLSQSSPSDYVIATGVRHSIKEFLSLAFSYYHKNWEDYVVIDDNFKRPNDVDYLCGNSNKLRKLGWEPSITFNELVNLMVESERVACAT